MVAGVRAAARVRLARGCGRSRGTRRRGAGRGNGRQDGRSRRRGHVGLVVVDDAAVDNERASSCRHEHAVACQVRVELGLIALVT